MAAGAAAPKQVVADFFASVVVPLDGGAAARLIAPDYRDHTFEADGLEAVEDFLASAAAAAPHLPEPVFQIADGDLVTTLHHLPQPAPQEPGSFYDYFWPNTFRVRDGRLVEAWPGINRIAPLRAPGEARETNEPVDPGAVDAAQLAANKRLVHDFFLQVFEGHDAAAAGRFVTEDYRQHSDLVPPGRRGLEGFVATLFPDGPVPPPASLPNPPRLTIAEGDLVVVVPLLPQPSPDDPDRSYPFFLHDSLRVRDGKLTDHWSGVDRAAPPRG